MCLVICLHANACIIIFAIPAYMNFTYTNIYIHACMSNFDALHGAFDVPVHLAQQAKGTALARSS